MSTPYTALHITPAAVPVTPPAVRNPLGVYGPIERMRMGQSLIKKRPTEVTACKHILAPDDPEFVLPPLPPVTRWCPRCQSLQDPDNFYPDTTRSTGFKAFCKPCDKEARHRRRKRKQVASVGASSVFSGRWYRQSEPAGQMSAQNTPLP